MNEAMQLYQSLGFKAQSEPYTVALRVRVPQKTADDLERLATALRQGGLPLTESDVVRRLLEDSLEGVREVYPLDQIELSSKD